MDICSVAGGAGFIGSHLCEALLKENRKVVCIDNFLTGTKDNIEHLLNRDKFRLIEKDITDKSWVIDHQLPDFTHIFHLASPASPDDYLKYPVETMLANSVGTYNILELARQHKAKFFLASTSEIYGDPKEHPQKESYWGNVNSLGPRSCYDESKRFAEALTMSYFRMHGLEVVIARIFNTYGPRMGAMDGRAIPNFITQALRKEPLTIYGDGSQTRSFCYIDDMIEGIIESMYPKERKTAGEVINLGNAEEITVLALAQEIQKICDSALDMRFLPLPKDDPTKRRPDLTKARQILNWQPTVSLKEGLDKSVAWFQTNLKKEKIKLA